MDYTEFFYTNYIGRYPFNTDAERKVTRRTINHLLESLDNTAKLFEVFESCADKAIIDFQLLPDLLWKDSLIKRNIFYFHPQLQIKSKPPVFDYANGINIVYPYFLEIKEQYTIDNMLEYAYAKLNIPEISKDYKRDKNSLLYLYRTYKNNSVIDQLDFVLFLIDTAANSGNRIKNILNLSDYADDTMQKIKNIVNFAKQKNFNKVVYRQ